MRPTGKHGLTLIELAVVLGIIMLVIALLLPAVMAARSAARQAQCLGNLHQMSIAFLLYSDTWQCYPPHQIVLADNARNRWFNSFAQDIMKDYAVMYDPETPERSPGRNAAYGYNYKYLGSARNNSFSPTHPFERFPVRLIESASRTIAFGCSDGTGTENPYERMPPDQAASLLAGPVRRKRVGNHAYVLDPTYIPEWSLNQTEPYADGNAASFLAPRHRGMANVVFVDGHAESRDPAPLYRDNTYWNGFGAEDARDQHIPDRAPNLRYPQ